MFESTSIDAVVEPEEQPDARDTKQRAGTVTENERELSSTSRNGCWAVLVFGGDVHRRHTRHDGWKLHWTTTLTFSTTMSYYYIPSALALHLARMAFAETWKLRVGRHRGLHAINIYICMSCFVRTHSVL